MVYNTMIQRIDGNHPRADDLIEFYHGRGFEPANNEEHAQELLDQGLRCYLVQDQKPQ